MTPDRANSYDPMSRQAMPLRAGLDGCHGREGELSDWPDAFRLAEIPADYLETWQSAGYHIVTPYAQPSLPPDLAASFALLLMRSIAALGLALFGRPARWLRNALAGRTEALQRARENRQQRRIFDRLDDHLLRDMGLSRCDLYDDLALRRGRDGVDIRR